MSINPRNLLDPSYWRQLWLDIQLAWKLVRDPRVPARAKAIPVLTILYILSPFDLISFIPILAQLDDLAVLILGVQTFIRIAPYEVVQELRSQL